MVLLPHWYGSHSLSVVLQLWLLLHRRLRTIAGRLVRELKRNLGGNHGYATLISLFERVLSQKRDTPDKIYSLNEPEVRCISKGKEHKKYEFGNKVSIIRSSTGIILGAKSFRNEYEGHTIEESLRQVERITGKKVRRLAGDRGYRGRKEVDGTQILIPDIPKKKDSYYTRKKKHRLFCKRAGIEPTIGHLKSDFRLGRNFYIRCVRRCGKCTFSRGSIQFQKSHEASFVACRKYQRNAVPLQYSAEIFFLRDD